MFNVFKKGNRRTTHSEISHSVFEGRRLTVVDSPGWFYINTFQETSEMDKLEIDNNVNLCPPGPHAVLLVVPLSLNYDKSYLRSVQEHMSLFGEEIWKHRLVLFTVGDWLGVKTVEERIESEEGLQWKVNKCENRYHVLNNKDQSDKTQVKELLEKIEEMWAGNEDPYYEVELDRAAELETKRETGDKMARRLKTINERQSRVLKELIGGEKHPITDIRIVLVGQKCSGKSVAGNMILFKDLFNITFNRAWLKKNYQDHREISTCVKHEGNFDGDWTNDIPVEDCIVREEKELLEKCGNRYHVLKNYFSDYPGHVKELFQKIIDMVKQSKECFSVEDRKEKIISFLWPPKQRTLTEKEWRKREQDLIKRVRKALAKEPEEPTEPHVRTAKSKDDIIPDMSGDVASEYGSISENRR